MQSSDAELIQRFLEGSAEAIHLVDGWISKASSPFRRRLGDDWEDLLQDVRLEVTRLLAAEKFRGDSTLKTYLWRVANNACVDRIRSRSRMQWEDLETLDHGSDTLRRVAAEHGSRRESRDLMLRVLSQTSEDCARLWGMLFEGLSYNEMSQRTGVSDGALRVRVLRCRKKAMAIRQELLEQTIPETSATDA